MRFRDAKACALIVFGTILAYLPALRGSLIWDDASHVTRSDLQSLHGLWRIWFDLGATQQYYPLLHSAFWLEHRLWGDGVLGYHLVNVALHALAACLVVAIARRLALPGGWLAGLLFALHPVNVEAVAWISEQKSVLSGVFYLEAALVYLEFDQSRRASRYWLALGLFVLALLSKTVTATLPAALLVVFWWRRGRIEWRRDVAPLLPWFAIGAAAGLFTAWVEATLIGAKGADFALTGWQRVLLAGRAIWFYAAKLVWPANLTFFYPRWTIDPADWRQYLFLLGMLAVAIGLWRVSRSTRALLAGFLFFAGTLFPVLGFLNVYPFRYSYVADHFVYLASLGILMPVAAWLTTRGRSSDFRHSQAEPPAPPLQYLRAPVGQAFSLPEARGSWRIPPAILVGVLAALTFHQSGKYRDEDTLYRATLANNPASWLAHNNLGNILLRTPGGRAEAIFHFEAALRAKPDYWEAHLSLGNALLQEPGRLADAIAEYRTALRLAPDSERAHTNLGNALLQAGQTDAAMAQLETALRIQPSNAEAHCDLGNALLATGKLEPAIAEYRNALRYDPNLAEAHNDLGRAMAQLPGRLTDAIAQFQEAIRLKPDYFGAHSNLGNALSEIPGRLPDAVAEYQVALRIHPDFAAAHNNLGYALSQLPGRLPDAISEYQTAIAISPDFASAHYNLANALLREGRQADALAEFEAGLRIGPNPQVLQIIERLRGRR